MSEVLTYRCTRDEMLDWLEDERKEDILEVMRAINELDEENYPYLLSLGEEVVSRMPSPQTLKAKRLGICNLKISLSAPVGTGKTKLIRFFPKRLNK